MKKLILIIAVILPVLSFSQEDQLSEKPFVFLDKQKYKLETDSYCETAEPYRTLTEAVNNIDLWYGTKNVFRTKDIKSLLINAYCIEKALVEFEYLWELVKKKISSWLVNSPLSIDAYIDDDSNNDNIPDKKSKFRTPEVLISTGDYFQNIFYLELEGEIKEILKNFNEEDLYILRNSFNHIPAVETAAQLNKHPRNIQTKDKKIKEEVFKKLRIINESYEEISEDEIFDIFVNEITKIYNGEPVN